MRSVSLKTLRLLFPLLFILLLSVIMGFAVWQLLRYRGFCRDGEALRNQAQSEMSEAFEVQERAFTLLTAICSKKELGKEDLDEYVFRTANLERKAGELFVTYRRSRDVVNLVSLSTRIASDAALVRSLSDYAHDPAYAEEARLLLSKSLVYLNSAAKSLRGLQDSLIRADIRRNRQNVAFVTHLFRFIMYSFAFAAALFLVGQMIITVITKKALLALGDGTRKFRDGRLDFRFDNIAADEIGQVKYDFNLMAHKLERQANDLRRANDELRAQAEKLIEAHQHKDKFLANMSHELRTPLNSIICFTELIQERAGKLSAERESDYAKKIITAAEHLLALITSLLDLAKCGAGTLEPVPTPFDLSHTVLELGDLLAPMAKKKGLTLTCEAEDGIFVHADKRMIQQIFMNLFSNAVKYTFQGGVDVRLRRDGDSAVLDIRDTGIGIAAEEQAKLFQDFYRVESATKLSVDGIGIGLALSRRLAQMNRGKITFISSDAPGESGSTFTLTLPLHQRNITPNGKDTE